MITVNYPWFSLTVLRTRLTPAFADTSLFSSLLKKSFISADLQITLVEYHDMGEMIAGQQDGPIPII